MNIQDQIIKTCDYYGVTPSELARMAGVSVHSLTRLVAGIRAGIRPDTVQKLEPFLLRAVDPGSIRG